MASIKEQFEIPGKLKTWSYALIGIGAAALLYGMLPKDLVQTNMSKYIFGEP